MDSCSPSTRSFVRAVGTAVDCCWHTYCGRPSLDSLFVGVRKGLIEQCRHCSYVRPIRNGKLTCVHVDERRHSRTAYPKPRVASGKMNFFTAPRPWFFHAGRRCTWDQLEMMSTSIVLVWTSIQQLRMGNPPTLRLSILGAH